MDFNVRGGRKYALVNESSGQVCHVNSYTGNTIGSRSTCYRARERLKRLYPEQQYVVYKLVRLGRKGAKDAC